MVSIRKVTYELEAKLKGQVKGGLSTPGGKLERKSYGDSGERLKILLRNLKSYNNQFVVVTADGKEIARIPIKNGTGRFDNVSLTQNDLPMLKAGQIIEVCIDGNLILSGELYED